MSTLPPEQNLRQRIALIQYPVVYLIVISSAPLMTTYAENPGLLTFFASALNSSFLQFGIPVLSCISGFLLFYRALDLNIRALIRMRFASHVIPLLVWNVPLLLVLYLFQSRGLTLHELAPGPAVYPLDLMVWINGVLAVTDAPLNPPLYLLRDLFVLGLLAPLLGSLLRHFPYLGLVAMLVVFAGNFDGWLIYNDIIPVAFYFGGMAATLNWNLNRLDQYAVHLLTAVLLTGIFFVLLEHEPPSWLPVLAPIVIWPISSVLVNAPTGRCLTKLSRAGFFLFLSHGLMIAALKIVFPYLYSGRFEFYVWLTVPFVVAVLGHFIFLFLDRYLPGFLNLLMGEPGSSGLRAGHNESTEYPITGNY